MRHLVPVLVLVVALALGNGLAYLLWTHPAAEARGRLAARRSDLEKALAVEAEELSKWRRIGSLVERARARPEPLFVERTGGRRLLRRAFLEAERGLSLRREALELRPDAKAPEGYRGVRVQLTATADFRSVLTYLDRIARIPTPLAPVHLTLKQSRKVPGAVVLTASWLALWPEGSGP